MTEKRDSVFEKQLEEAYRGFGQSAHMDVEELRILYYGRPNIYVVFTDDGDVDTSHSGVPDCFVSYELNDVIGKRVKSSDFYAYVIRPNISGGQFIKDVKEYTRDRFIVDMRLLQEMKVVPVDRLQDIISVIGYSSYIRHDIMRLWAVTEAVAGEISDRYQGEEWRRILMSLGYVGMSDPSGVLGVRNTTYILDYESREDLDILPIQKHREDPRRRIEKYIDRQRMKMRGTRNRIGKKSRDNSRRVF